MRGRPKKIAEVKAEVDRVWMQVEEPPKQRDVRSLINDLRRLADDLERLENGIGALLGR